MSTSYYIPSSSLDKSYVTKSELQDDLTDYYTKYALTSGTTNLKLGNATVVGVLTNAGGVSITYTDTCSSTSTGSLILTKGGIGIAGNEYIAQDLNVGRNCTITGALNIAGSFSISNTDTSTSTSTGALILSKGGMGMAYNCNVGQDLIVTRNETVTGVLTNAGGVSITNTTNPTSTSTGALIIGGGVAMAKDLYIGKNITLGDTTTPSNTMITNNNYSNYNYCLGLGGISAYTGSSTKNITMRNNGIFHNRNKLDESGEDMEFDKTYFSSYQTITAGSVPVYCIRGSANGKYLYATTSYCNYVSSDYHAGTIIASNDYGQTWVSTGFVSNTYCGIKVSPDGSTIITPIGNGGTVLISYDYGLTTSTLYSTTNNYQNVDASDDMRIIYLSIYGRYNNVLISIDYGTTFTAISRDSGSGFRCNWLNCSSDGSCVILSDIHDTWWVYGSRVYYSGNFGASGLGYGTAIFSAGTGIINHGLWISPDGKKLTWYQNNTNKLYLSLDAGLTNWIILNGSGNATWPMAFFSTDMHRGVLANGNVQWYTSDYGLNWTSISGITSYGGAYVSSNGNVSCISGNAQVFIHYKEKNKIVNTTKSTSTSTGALTIAGGLGVADNEYIGGDLNVGRNCTISGVLNIVGGISITGTDTSTSTSTGALVLTKGGLGIAYNCNVGQDLIVTRNETITGVLTNAGGISITNTDTCTSTSTGALILTKGGLAVAGNEYIEGDLNIGRNCTISGALNIASGFSISGTDTSTSTSTGALVLTKGGLGIAYNCNVGQDLIVTRNETVTGVLTSAGGVAITNATVSADSLSGALTVAGGVGIHQQLNVGSYLFLNNDSLTSPNSTLFGAIICAGGVAIGENINVGGYNHIQSKKVVAYPTSTTTAQGALVVAGGALIQGTDTCTSTNTGSLVVNNGIACGGNEYIAQDLNVGRNCTISGTLNIAGGFSISGTEPSTSTSSGALVLTKGGLGIAYNCNVGQDLIVTRNCTISGMLDIAGGFSITGTDPSTSTSTGALVLTKGGLGIAYNCNVGQDLIVTRNETVTGVLTNVGGVSITNTDTCTSTSTGALVLTKGGIAIAGNEYIAQDLNVGRNCTISGALSIAGGFSITGTDISTSTSTGALVLTKGGLGMAYNCNVGQDLHVAQGATITGALSNAGGITVTLTTDSGSTNTGSMILDGGLGCAKTIYCKDLVVTSTATFLGALTMAKGVVISDASLCISTDTGALQLSIGGLGIADNEYIGQDLNVARNCTITGVLTNAGGVSITYTNTCTSTSTGSLVLTNGGIACAQNEYIGGNLNVVGTCTITGALVSTGILTINSTATSTATNGGALIVQGGININCTTNTYETSSKTGALIINSGGISCGGNEHIAGNLGVGYVVYINGTDTGSSSNSGALIVQGGVDINCTSNSTSTCTGALLVLNGGIGCGGNAYFAGDLNARNCTLTNNCVITGGLTITYSHDFAQNWLQVPIITGIKFTYMRGSTDGHYIYGSTGGLTSGGIYISNNYGVLGSWSTTAGFASDQYWDFDCSLDGSIVIAGHGSNSANPIQISTNYGASASNAGDCPSKKWYCVCCSDTATKMYACASTDKLIYLSTNSGTNWTTVAPTGITWTDNDCSADGSIVYLGSTTGLYISTDSGGSFAQIGGTSTWNCYNVRCSSDGNFVGCTYKISTTCYVGFSPNQGAMWYYPSSPTPTTNGTLGMSAVGDRIIYSLGFTSGTSVSGLYYSTDYGVTFTSTYKTPGSGSRMVGAFLSPNGLVCCATDFSSSYYVSSDSTQINNSIQSTYDSTATNSGALTINGGLGIGKTIYCNDLSVASTATFLGALTIAGGVAISKTTASSDSLTGALTVAGGLGVVKSLYCNKAIIEGDDTSTSTSTGSLVLTYGGLAVAENINVGVGVKIQGIDLSTSTSTGALVLTSGGIAVASNANIAGVLTITKTSSSTATNGGCLIVSGGVNVNCTTQATDTKSGAMMIAGGLSVARDFYYNNLYPPISRYTSGGHSSLNYYQEVTGVTLTYSGPWAPTTPTGTIDYVIIGKVAHVRFNYVLVTSTTNATISVANYPSILVPVNKTYSLFRVCDDGDFNTLGLFDLGSATPQIGPHLNTDGKFIGGGSGFTGFDTQTISYLLE